MIKLKEITGILKKFINFKGLRMNFLSSALIFFIVMTVYLFTLAPTVYIEDSGELITAAATLGIPHPSGYPLWVLLGKLFTFIPLGSIAWRVNLMSAVFGALTASLLFLIIQKLIRNRLIAFFVALLLPFSSIFWSQSLISEVYTLNSFFVALLILIMMVWQEKRQNKQLFWLAFLYGLSLTNHQMMGLIGPAFLIFILSVDRSFYRKFGLIFKMLLLFVVGLSVYLYLPIIAAQNPLFNWGNPKTLQNFWAHVSRKAYSDFSVVSQSKSKLVYIYTFFLEIIYDFYLPAFLLSLMGLVNLFFKKFKFGLMTFLIFIFNSIGIIILRNVGWGVGGEYVHRVYYLPCFLIIVIWLGAIMGYLYRKVVELIQGRRGLLLILKVLFYLVLVSLPINFFILNYDDNNLSDFWLEYDYSKELLASLEPNAVYIFMGDGTVVGDTELFGLIYLQMVEKFRPDVFIVTENNFFYKKVDLQLGSDYNQKIEMKKKETLLKLIWPAAQKNNFPVYTNFIVNQKTAGDLKLFGRSTGIVYKIYPSLEQAKNTADKFYPPIIRNFDEKSFVNDYSAGGLVSYIYYNLAAYYLENNQGEYSQRCLINAANLDLLPNSQQYQIFLTHRNEWLGLSANKK